MRREYEDATDQEAPTDVSTLVLGEVTDLTKDLVLLDPRFDIWLWGQWGPPPPPDGN